MRVRSLLAIALVAVSVLSATGIVASHAFHQPTTVKYVVTVLAPLLLAVACLANDPLRLSVGAAIVAAPWDLNVTFEGTRVAPISVLLALAVFIALPSPRDRVGRVSVTGSFVVLALALLLPSLAIGREIPHYITWIIMTLAAGWLAFQIAQRPGGLRFLMSCVVAGAALQSLIAIYEYARHANLNLYSAEVSQAVSQHYFFNFGKDFRPAGTLPDPDSLGNVLALACPLAIVLALSASTRALRLTWAASAVLITVGLTLTFSRASWVGAGLGVIIVLIALPGGMRLPATAAIVALTVLTVAIALSVGGSSLTERFSSIQNPTSRQFRTAHGDQERQQIWSSALTIAADHPGVGVGMGRLQEHLSEHLGASHEGLHAQSVYFQFLAESGIAGAIALLLLIGHAGTGILAGLRRQRVLTAGVAGAFIAILVGWSTDTTARYTSVSVLIAFVFGAAMAQHARQPQSAEVRVSLGELSRRRASPSGA